MVVAVLGRSSNNLVLCTTPSITVSQVPSFVQLAYATTSTNFPFVVILFETVSLALDTLVSQSFSLENLIH